MVVDPHGNQAVYILPGTTQTIDPTLTHWLFKYFYNEKLHFYVKKKQQSFYKKYQLTERYCTDDPEAERLAFTKLEELAKNPTDRLSVHIFEYKAKKHKHHTHKH